MGLHPLRPGSDEGGVVAEQIPSVQNRRREREDRRHEASARDVRKQSPPWARYRSGPAGVLLSRRFTCADQIANLQLAEDALRELPGAFFTLMSGAALKRV